jgi:hypothetical protein
MGYYRGLAAVALLKILYAGAYSLSKIYHQQLDYDSYARWLQGPGWFYPIALLAAASAALLHVTAFIAFRSSSPLRIYRFDVLAALISAVAFPLFCFLLSQWK